MADSRDFRESNSKESKRLLGNKLKYEETIEEKLNVEYLVNEFNNKLEFIKEEIDLRIDSLTDIRNQKNDNSNSNSNSIEFELEFESNELIF
jgi:hypothetical protein